MNSHQIARKNHTREIDYTFSFDPFCIELSLSAEQETNWVILQTVREIIDTMLRLKDRGAAFQEELFELVAHCVLTPMVAREKVAWGIVQPNPPFLRYATPALAATLQSNHTIQAALDNYPTDPRQVHDLRDQLLYTFLLQKLYGWQVDTWTAGTLNLDTRFLEVSTSHELPTLNHHQLQECCRTGNALDYLRNSIPLSLFQFEGFACVQPHI